MQEVKVERVAVFNNTELVVILREDNAGRRALPIHIEPGQAHAIAIHLDGPPFPRPLTHDLMKNIIEDLGGRLVRAEVCDLRDRTFYAELVLACGGGEKRLDARPSDAIALALRCEAPIFVDEKVMDAAGVHLQEPPEDERKKLSPLQTIEAKLGRAIREERYEDAAALRDEIKILKDRKTKN